MRTPVPRDGQHRSNLRATIAFLRLPLTMLHRAFTWVGLGQLAGGLARQGYWLSLSHIAAGGWRRTLKGDDPLLAPRGFGVGPTPWAALQRAGWAAVRR
jgi:hypothetical protein